MRRKRVLVTGGAGFLGSHLGQRLLEMGYDVLCLDNFLTGLPANVAHLRGRRGFRLRKGDVCDQLDVTGPIDAVLHFASPASPVDYLRYPVPTLRAGSLGTLNALELAAEKHARFVLASTSET
jgi:dTDP-glucose 4,6-dehydratase